MLARYVDETFDKPVEYMHFFKDIFFYDDDYEGSRSALDFWTSVSTNNTKLDWDTCTYKDIPKIYFRRSTAFPEKLFLKFTFINSSREVIDEELKDCTIKEIIHKINTDSIRIGFVFVHGNDDSDHIEETEINNIINIVDIHDILADDWVIYI